MQGLMEQQLIYQDEESKSPGLSRELEGSKKLLIKDRSGALPKRDGLHPVLSKSQLDDGSQILIQT